MQVSQHCQGLLWFHDLGRQLISLIVAAEAAPWRLNNLIMIRHTAPIGANVVPRRRRCYCYIVLLLGDPSHEALDKFLS